MTAAEVAFLREWEGKGFPPFKPLPPVFREEDDGKGRGNLVLRRMNPLGVLTVREVAAWAGVCVQAIYTRGEMGEFDCGPFPVYKIGKALRIPVETFARWAEEVYRKKGGKA